MLFNKPSTDTIRRSDVKNLDQEGILLIISVVIVMIIGLIAQTSALGDSSPFFWRQLTWYGLALTIIFLMSRLDYRILNHHAILFLIAVCILLILVLSLGVVGGGSRRWIGFGALRLQPSELAKIAIVLWVSHYTAKNLHTGTTKFLDLTIPLTVMLLIAGLVLVQPDLGTALIIVFEGMAVLYISGIHRRVQMAILSSSILAAIFAWFFVLHDYQKNRVFTFLNPEKDPLGIGYHSLQSKIAIGSGGFFGRGIGGGTQTTLSFLPEQHTDFIFSVWAETWGFLGGAVLLSLYSVMLLLLVRIALEAKDYFGRLVVVGIFTHFFLHVAINTAMVLGWAPVVGVPLPWLTYGGSAIMVNALGIGIALSVHRHRYMF